MLKKELDKSILEGIKDRIINYIKSKKIGDIKAYRENMDEVGKLYAVDAENKFKMLFCMEKENQKPEIDIDNQFIEFDEKGNPIGIDKKIKKLIISQLGHELLHAASTSNEKAGVKKNIYSVGINEGITQMLTERVFGYIVSPNTDKYKDLKKGAKILGVTFGDEVILDSYLNHTDNLEKKCFEISQDPYIYDEICRIMYEMYAIRSKRIYLNRDMHFKSIARPIYKKLNEMMLQKICINVIVPKLKSLSEEEQFKYIADILKEVKDDQEVSRKLSSMITKYANYSKEQIEKLNSNSAEEFVSIKTEAFLVKEIYNNPKGRNLRKYFTMTDDGKVKVNQLTSIVKDGPLKEKILAQSILSKHDEKKKKEFENKVIGVCQQAEANDNKLTLELTADTTLGRMKILSAMKLYAEENGYLILNSLSECESNSINLETLHIKREEQTLDFADLQRLFEKYTIDYEDGYPEDFNSEMFVKERETGKEVDDYTIQNFANFANIWAESAGVKVISGEKLPGETYAFSEESKNVYEKISGLISKSLEETGTIKTEKIIQELSNDSYKYAEEIARNLFANQTKIDIVYNFYKSQVKNFKLEVEHPKTSFELTYGFSQDEMIEEESKEIVRKISSAEIAQRCEEEGITVSEVKGAFENMMANVKENSKDTQKDEKKDKPGEGEIK